MNKEEILTEYFEDMQQPGDEGDVVVLDVEEPMDEVIEIEPETLPENAFIISFSEEDDSEFEDDEFFFDELSFEEDEIGFEDFDLEEISFDEEELGELGEEFSEEIKELKEEISKQTDDNLLPGATEPILDDEEDQEDEADDVETNWVDDRDPSKFINYLRDSYTNIPPHSGNTISGCERALAYLNKLNKEISEAVRKDDKNALDDVLDEIEEYRVKILKGMVALKKRIGDLKRKFKEEGSQKIASDTSELIKESLESSDMIKKEAKSGKFQVVITPFERAITGMLINSVVSAGHPFEEVYEYLKKKFNITDREELAILQIIMDMGYPIFKDRGTIGDDEGDGSGEGQGIDFIKNYFA